MESALEAGSVRSSAIEAILAGGLTAGVLDGLDAVIYYGLRAGVSPTRIFQHIASGVLGPSSFSDGWATVLLGLVLHFTIAIGAATVYYAASRFWPLLVEKPLLCGIAFGLIVFAVMQYGVVPLSAVRVRTAAMPVADLVDQLFSHTCFVGLPIAFFTSRAHP